MKWRENVYIDGMGTVPDYPEIIADRLMDDKPLGETAQRDAGMLIRNMADRLDAAETLLAQLRTEVGFQLTGNELNLLKQAFGKDS